VNNLDTFNGTREYAQRQKDRPILDIGYVTAVDPVNIKASVKLPYRNTILKNLPISFNFMSYEFGNISFPQIGSPVIIMRSRNIPPFILCSAGKLFNYGSRSDLTDIEQLFANKARAFLKQACDGGQNLVSGNFDVFEQDSLGQTSKISRSFADITPNCRDFVTTIINGYGINYKKIVQRTIRYTVSSASTIETNAVNIIEYAKALADKLDACINAPNGENPVTINSLRSISEFLDTKDIFGETEYPTSTKDNIDEFSEAILNVSSLMLWFNGSEIVQYGDVVVVQTGARISSNIENINELEDEMADTVDFSGARTIFSLDYASSKNGDLEKKFSVTNRGAKINEGSIGRFVPNN